MAMTSARRLVRSWAIVACLGAVSAAHAQPGDSLAMFRARVAAYVIVHRHCVEQLRVNGAGPNTTFQEALGHAIRRARHRAQPGDIFGPVAAAIVQLVRANMAARSPKDRLAIRAEVPRVLALHVNDRYPAGAPFATVPPELLVRFPDIPPELQYRFLDRALILLDVDANVIVDMVPKVLQSYP
jgi:hypothetical protein